MNSERAESLFVEDLKGMIKFLEEHTPGRMDWNRLKEICENRNRIVELEMEVWDMVRTRPAPLASEAIYFSHFLLFNTFTWHKETVRLWEKLVKLGRKNLEKGKGAVENEKYRAVVWNAPFIHFVDIFNKLENEYGLVVVMDSLSYNNIPLIDTSSPESMLKGLAHIIMEGPMVRNTRGPKENYYDYMFQCWKQFDLDMVWMSNNINCKSAQGMNGMLREMCREKNIPYFVLDYDLLDPRTINSDNMMKQVDHFMENVMKARRIEK
jgi:benzoyl-CoA reductase/2-hydroxyglutaryl-CoA dehydratase subunit BcrC/BadD/HgdB